MWLEEYSYRQLHDALDAYYGTPKPKPQYDPLTELLRTLLTQNTSDRNSDRSFASLRAKYPTWEDVYRADVADIEASIKVGGLSTIKSQRIKAILNQIYAEHKQLTLDFIKDWETEKIFNYLRALPGIGDKTIGCVLTFSLLRPVFIVDTHVHRIMPRLDALPKHWTAEKMQTFLTEHCPSGIITNSHILVIQHGRTLCKPRNPTCTKCPITKMCSYIKDNA